MRHQPKEPRQHKPDALAGNMPRPLDTSDRVSVNGTTLTPRLPLGSLTNCGGKSLRTETLSLAHLLDALGGREVHHRHVGASLVLPGFPV